MRRKVILISLILLVLCAVQSMAERQLDRSEILQLFQQLTEKPRDTWIPAGTIEGIHEEYRAAKVTDVNQIRAMMTEKVAAYRANLDKPEKSESLIKLKLDAIPFNTRYELSNEHTMRSTELVKYDGQRFKWKIDIQSRVDSVKPGKDLAGNFMTNQFNMELNANKVYAWDGEAYVKYFPLAEHAYVDAADELPHVVNGPLTAGLIPWGYGYYSYENLSSMQSEAVETIVDGQTRTHLTLIDENDCQFSFELDPSREYAVYSYLMTGRDNAAVSNYYSGYENISGQWIPMSILLDRYEADSQKLLARDVWTITAVDANTPAEESLEVQYEQGTLIEYASPITANPLIYRHQPVAQTDAILGEKLSFDAKQGYLPQNCATASMKYALNELGVNVSDAQLAELVSESDNSTSLYAMKSFVRNLGLNSRVVQTNLDTIREMADCQIILYFPQKQHFVVLDSIDSKYVWIVDLASRKFYYRTDISFFDMDWTTGVAFIISDNIIRNDLPDLDYNELVNIVGSSGYACTKLLQSYDIIYCEKVSYECLGDYTIYWSRWGCESAESGSCSYGWYERVSRSPCLENIYKPGSCTITGDWTNYWMRACE